jgi:hypothetical protein
MQDKVTFRTLKPVNSEDLNLQTEIMTFTFEVGNLVLDTTHLHDVVVPRHCKNLQYLIKLQFRQECVYSTTKCDLDLLGVEIRHDILS